MGDVVGHCVVELDHVGAGVSDHVGVDAGGHVDVGVGGHVEVGVSDHVQVAGVTGRLLRLNHGDFLFQKNFPDDFALDFHVHVGDVHVCADVFLHVVLVTSLEEKILF